MIALYSSVSYLLKSQGIQRGQLQGFRYEKPRIDFANAKFNIKVCFKLAYWACSKFIFFKKRNILSLPLLLASPHRWPCLLSPTEGLKKTVTPSPPPSKNNKLTYRWKIPVQTWETPRRAAAPLWQTSWCDRMAAPGKALLLRTGLGLEAAHQRACNCQLCARSTWFLSEGAKHAGTEEVASPRAQLHLKGEVAWRWMPFLRGELSIRRL